jgi:hypothetical protein
MISNAKNFLARFAAQAADNQGLPRKRTEQEINSVFSINDIKGIKSIFADEHAGKKIVFGGLIAVGITILGGWLVVDPPKHLPEACKENGPAILAAGVSLLGGFFIGKI